MTDDVTIQPAAIPQTPADAATEAAIDGHLKGAAPEQSEKLFNRATVEHQRAAATQETGTDQGWRDGNEVAPLAPMPPPPTLAANEVEAAKNKLNGYGYSHADLVIEWGSDFGDNLGYAKAAFREVAASDPDLIAKVEASGLGDHPAVLQFLARQGRLSAGLMDAHIMTRNNEPMPINRTAPSGPSGDHRGSEETRTELARLMRESPPGSARYKEPHIQARIQMLHSTIAGSGSIVGSGGRRA
jgi:hypothetical protein